ncbi:amino acid ABC transporter substrate-binding protein [Thermodesulfobacteriota bacterium]
MKIKSLLGFLVLAFISVFTFPDCSPKPPPKDKIRIGRAVSLTGPNAIIAKSASIPVYDLWVDEINEKGGIYVKEYKKRLPIELIVYDDESDYEKMVLLLQKLIVEDEVDFVLPPCNTLFLFAAAPVANKLGYILLGAEGGAMKIEEYAAALPYFFPVLNFADTQMKALAELYKENGINSVAIVYIEDLHGTEYSSAAIKEFEKKGITVKTARSIPLGAKDISPLLKRAKALDVDAFVGFTYPGESILAVKQAIGLGINFKVFHVNVGPSFGWFPGLFGKAAEGLMGSGAWNCKSSPGAEEFCQKFIGRYGEPAADWWGHLLYYASLQFFEQAIEEAGTLNQEKIRDVMVAERFETVLGETWFEGGRLAPACHPGEIGQWQNGVFEVIGRKEKATARPLIPKPVWPAPIPKPEQQTSGSS